MKNETWCKQTQGTKDPAPAAHVTFGGYNFEHNNQASKFLANQIKLSKEKTTISLFSHSGFSWQGNL